MEVYWGFLFILFAFSTIELYSHNSKLKNTLLWVVYVFVVIIIGLRWETGTDWNPYINNFKTVASTLDETIEQNFGMEQGYLTLVYLVRLFTDNYVYFLLLHALIFYYCILFGLKKVTTFPITSFLYIFTSTLGVIGSNRQLLAVAIVFYCLTWAINKKKKFFGAVILSATFHLTALITSLYYFFNKRLKLWFIFVLLLTCLIIGYSSIPTKIFSLTSGINEHALDKVDAYLKNRAEGLTITGIIRRIVFISFFLLIRSKTEKYYKNYNFFLNGFLASIMIYLLFSQSLIILVNRGSLYFNIFEALLLTAFLYTLKKAENKFVYLIILFILCIWSMYQSISGYPDLFDPYKGIWYNYNYYRNMY